MQTVEHGHIYNRRFQCFGQTWLLRYPISHHFCMSEKTTIIHSHPIQRHEFHQVLFPFKGIHQSRFGHECDRSYESLNLMNFAEHSWWPATINHLKTKVSSDNHPHLQCFPPVKLHNLWCSWEGPKFLLTDKNSLQHAIRINLYNSSRT